MMKYETPVINITEIEQSEILMVSNLATTAGSDPQSSFTQISVDFNS